MPSKIPWVVVDVQTLGNYRLRVRFNDGLTGEVDMSGLVDSPTAGVFAVLADQDLFQQVFVDSGAVAWPVEIDLAPDAMYESIKETGIWVLT